MPDSTKRLLEVYKVVEQIALVLWMFPYDDSTIKGLFYCATARSKPCLFFCRQFLSFGLESVEDYWEHDLAGMANYTGVTIVLTLLEVAYL